MFEIIANNELGYIKYNKIIIVDIAKETLNPML